MQLRSNRQCVSCFYPNNSNVLQANDSLTLHSFDSYRRTNRVERRSHECTEGRQRAPSVVEWKTFFTASPAAAAAFCLSWPAWLTDDDDDDNVCASD